jgi:hypothetical protein
LKLSTMASSAASADLKIAQNPRNGGQNPPS